MPLPQGVTLTFNSSGFSADLLSFTVESSRGDYELSTFDDVYRAMATGDLADASLSMGIGFDPDTNPPIDQDIERIDLQWIRTGSETTGALWYFDGFFTLYDPAAVVDGYMTAQTELKITGGITYLTGIRGCRVAPSGQADYLNSTEAAKLRYGWIASSSTGKMSNGDDPYLVMKRGTS